MNGRSGQDLQQFVMSSGYWFFVCKQIQSTFDDCLASTPTQSKFPTDDENYAICVNKQLCYNTQMYNLFPIFDQLASVQTFREDLLKKCENEIQAISSGKEFLKCDYPSKAAKFNRSQDDLSAVLNGTKKYKMKPVSECFRTAKWWTYNEEKGIDHPVQILGNLTEDIDLLFKIQDVIDTFDFKQTKWLQICDFAKKVFDSTDDNTRIMNERQITSLPMYNYLSEEDEEAGILWKMCSLDKTHNNEQQLENWKTREQMFLDLFQ